MRIVRHTPWILLAWALSCATGKTVPESGAVLLAVKCPDGVPVPDELRAWVYDDGGRIWDGMRIPEQGPLAVANARSLGTILVAPGAIQGKLRIHLRGLAAGVRVLDGVLIIDSLAGDVRTFDLLLDPALPLDEDLDDVPDSIDDCLGIANPAQGGCPGPVLPDAAAADGGGVETSPDASPAGPEDGAGLPPDVALGSPEAGAETPRDVWPAGLDGGSEAPSDALPASPDGKDAEQDDSADRGYDVAPDGARVEVGDGALAERPDLAPAIDAGEAGADADVNLDTATSDAADASAPEDDSGCGDACGKPQGAVCEANEECASGACADGVCCTNACAGPCRSCNQPTANGTCRGYAAGSDPEGECQGGELCNGVGACGPPPTYLPNGQLCSSPSQCQSGFCADGVCCNSDCTTPCMACGTGTCLVVAGTEDVPECSGTKTCNRKGKCVVN